MISKRFKNDSKPFLKLNTIQFDAKHSVENKIQNGKYQFEDSIKEDLS